MPLSAHPLQVSKRSRIALIMAVALVALLLFIDARLADRAERLYRQAQQVAAGRLATAHLHRIVHKGSVIVHADHVPASLCYAFTGGLRLSVLLLRSHHIQAEHPTVSSASGNCAPGDVNTLLFTFSAAQAPPP